MRPQREIPPEWADRMLQLGFTHNSKPSARRLAEHAGVTVNAALRVIHRGKWGEATAVALGQALRDPEFVAGWVGMPPGEAWDPPVDARRLTARQRALVEDLIRELAEKGGQQDAGQAKAEKSPGRRSRKRLRADEIRPPGSMVVPEPFEDVEHRAD